MENTTGNKPLGVALTGAGMIAKTQFTALSTARETMRLDAVVSRHPERASYLAGFYEGAAPLFTADPDKVAASSSIQMAIVATPPNVRSGLIRKLAVAGKHILLEKPVGRTVAEVQEVVDICERARVNLWVVFQHHTRASSVAASRLVADGALGKLGLVEISVPLWRPQSYYDEPGRGTYDRDGGGVMITNAIHSLDLALSLTGPVAGVQAMTATTPLHRMEAEDFAVAGLHFACGAVGSFVASTAMFPHRTESITLHCENGSLRIDKDSLVVDWRDGCRDAVGQAADGTADPLLGGRHE